MKIYLLHIITSNLRANEVYLSLLKHPYIEDEVFFILDMRWILVLGAWNVHEKCLYMCILFLY